MEIYNLMAKTALTVNNTSGKKELPVCNISQSFFLFFSNVMLKLHMLFGELPTISCDLAVVKEVLLLYTLYSRFVIHKFIVSYFESNVG